MSRESSNEVKAGRLVNGFDYENQWWVIKGIIQRCGHPETMDCGCRAKAEAGKQSPVNQGV